MFEAGCLLFVRNLSPKFKKNIKVPLITNFLLANTQIMICISKLSTTCMYVRGGRGEGRDRSSSSFMVLGPRRHEWVMVLGP